ncbi:tautomerase family protein [Acidovorax sp.]|uniref:tautomerase family protein n=1 Tax=Acidovorax sp. TaxID=1872122 RepID=UPI003919414C
MYHELSPQEYQRLLNTAEQVALQLRRDIDDLPAARWHIGGAPVEQPTALLEISITQGTNTGEEKAAFIVAAFAELQRQLAGGGALAAASYVVVRELPGSDWGWGGRTQQARKTGVA